MSYDPQPSLQLPECGLEEVALREVLARKLELVEGQFKLGHAMVRRLRSEAMKMREAGSKDMAMQELSETIPDQLKDFIERRQVVGLGMHLLHTYLQSLGSSDLTLEDFALKLHDLQRLQCTSAEVMYGLGHCLQQIDDVTKRSIADRQIQTQTQNERDGRTCSVQ
jgi:hypothetical protein